MSMVKVPLKIQLSKPVALWTAAGGGMLAVLAVISFSVAAAFIPKQFEILNKESGEPLVLSLLVFLGGLLIIYSFSIGVGEALSGIRRLLQPTLEADGPEPFLDYAGELLPALREGKLQFFGSVSARLRVLFGQNIVALAPSTRPIVAANGHSLLNRAITLPAWTLLIVLVIINDWPGLLLLPLGLLVGGSLIQAAVEYFASTSIVPATPRLARPHHTSQHYKGFGHPTHLFQQIPILAESLALPGFPNKVYQLGAQERASQVRDIAEFSGAILIEKQPTLLETETSRGGLLLLTAGWSFSTIAALILVWLASPYAYGTNSNFWPMVLTVFVVARFFMKGSSFRRQGVTLLETLHFRSVVLLLGVAGETSRADVEIGHGQNDSIHTKNLTARSNFTAQFWTGELISEARSVESRRQLLQVLPSQESKNWLNHFLAGIENLRGEAVQVVVPDLTSREAQAVIIANNAIRANSNQSQPAGAQAPGALPTPPLQLSDSIPPPPPNFSPDNNQGEDLKECPRCAEKIRLRAKVCRFCGHQFEH